jgi:FlaA1/EpsC-like NDP-sugar epimerase
MKKLLEKRKLLMLFFDGIVVVGCYGLTCLIYYFLTDKANTVYVWLPIIAYYLVTVVIFHIFKVYDVVWRYADSRDFVKCMKATVVAVSIMTSIFVLINYYFPENLVRLEYLLFSGSTITCGLIGYRIVYRYFQVVPLSNTEEEQKNMLIVGAGFLATRVIEELKFFKNYNYSIVGMLSDNPSKLGRNIKNIPVIDTNDNVIRVCKEKEIQVILVAKTFDSINEKNKIIEDCIATGCEVNIIPEQYGDIPNENIANKIRKIEIEDLLGRDQVVLKKENYKYLENKVVLVTGGGGSIGSEICRQVASIHPKTLVVLDIYENNAYNIQQELIRHYGDTLDIQIEIASVRDLNKLEYIFKKHKPQIIFHAAAHKHVPLMETNPDEAIKNNVMGTYNTAQMADKYGVERFVLISTDKAVNPTNIMGATKRIAEMIINVMNRKSKTKFCAVRFGNVLGSNGSVVPLFKKQIKEGGPVTVTHKDIIRYFMTIPEACMLVLKAGGITSGGELFILDMGEPVKISELAKKMIVLSGFEVDKDIRIEYTGLRPGEKLYEELLLEAEDLESTVDEKIFIVGQEDIDEQWLKDKIHTLDKMAKNFKAKEIVEFMPEVVNTYKNEEGFKQVV